MKVVNNKLCTDDGNPVTFKKSPNIGGKLKSHKYLIIHYTATSSASSAINWMVNPDTKVSAHLHLDKEGGWVQLVDFDTTAWHVGSSEWKGLVGLNSHTLGIEICNSGNEPYTPKQLDALTEASIALHEHYKFEDILGHEEVATPRGRKSDPGRYFPMASFKEEVLQTNSKNIAPTKKVTTELNLREGIGTSFKIITVLKKDTEVNVLDEYNGWSQVFYCEKSLKGWVSSTYLR